MFGRRQHLLDLHHSKVFAGEASLPHLRPPPLLLAVLLQPGNLLLDGPEAVRDVLLEAPRQGPLVNVALGLEDGPGGVAGLDEVSLKHQRPILTHSFLAAKHLFPGFCTFFYAIF